MIWSGTMSTISIHPPRTPVTEGSDAKATATVPNVCKMPGPPAPFVPTALPNVGRSGISPKGYSKRVKMEGHRVAIRGASFGSQGDVASKASGGGLVSANTQGPTKFIAPGSLTVRIEGKNVHLLGDSTLNNCGPSGAPANAATLAGVLQKLLQAATTEPNTTTCTNGGGHEWLRQDPSGNVDLNTKIAEAKASPRIGPAFEGLAAEHNKSAGDLTRSDQLSGSSNDEKIWWICGHCPIEREGDQLHDDPGGGEPIIVEVKSKTKLDERDARQLGRNCNAVLQGNASGLIYKLPGGPQYAWVVKHVRDMGNHFNVPIRVMRI